MGNAANIIRVGQVSSVNPRNNTCRVAFDDEADPNGRKFVSAEMQLLQHNTVSARNLTLPDVGEHVLCTFLPDGQEEGFILGSYYTAGNMPEGHGTGVYRTVFADGTVIEYDLESNTARIRSNYYVEVEAKVATVTATETITATAGEAIKADAPLIEMTAPTVKITGAVEIVGDITVAGSINASGDILAGGDNSNHHSH